MELTTFAMTVAVATPETPQWNNTTKISPTVTLSTPEMASTASGAWVSPMLRKMAVSKLYSRMTGMPMR